MKNIDQTYLKLKVVQEFCTFVEELENNPLEEKSSFNPLMPTILKLNFKILSKDYYNKMLKNFLPQMTQINNKKSNEDLWDIFLYANKNDIIQNIQQLNQINNLKSKNNQTLVTSGKRVIRSLSDISPNIGKKLRSTNNTQTSRSSSQLSNENFVDKDLKRTFLNKDLNQTLLDKDLNQTIDEINNFLKFIGLESICSIIDKINCLQYENNDNLIYIFKQIIENLPIADTLIWIFSECKETKLNFNEKRIMFDANVGKEIRKINTLLRNQYIKLYENYFFDFENKQENNYPLSSFQPPININNMY